MSTLNKQYQEIFERYQAEVGTDPVDIAVVARWALDQGHVVPRESDVITRIMDQMRRALREQTEVDASGRSYRTKHAITVSSAGKQTSFWADIETAPREHMEKAFAQRRNQIVGDCFQLRNDVDHYNEARSEDIQLELDFNYDVEEKLLETLRRRAA